MYSTIAKCDGTRWGSLALPETSSRSITGGEGKGGREREGREKGRKRKGRGKGKTRRGGNYKGKIVSTH